MANYTAYDANEKAGLPFSKEGKVYLLSRSVDLQSLGVASGDTVDVFPIPAGVRVLDVVVSVDRVSDAATSATLDVTGIMTGVDLKTAGESRNSGAGKRYTSDGTLQLALTYSGTTTDAGKVTVEAVCIR